MRDHSISRWVMAIGAALAASIGGFVVLRLVGGLSMLPLVPTPEGRPASLASWSCVLAGALFVYVGARYSPANQHRVALVLNVVTAGTGLGAFLLLAFSTGTPSAALAGWWVLFGGVLGWVPYFKDPVPEPIVADGRSNGPVGAP